MALAIALSGCVAFGNVDQRATALNESTGTAQNRSILLNIVRASRSEPIYFLAMTQLNGSGTEDFRLGVPELTFGPKQAATQKDYIFGGTANSDTNYLDNSIVTSFQESVLNSKDFYAGLMSPLDLNDVDLLLHQGFARELIFELVIDRATITPKGGEPIVIYNDPTDAKRFAIFQGYIREAMLHGLTTQSFLAPDDTEAPGEEDSGSSGKSSSSGKPKLTAHAELCYDRALAAPDARRDFPPGANICGQAPSVRTSSAQASNLQVVLHGEQLEIVVTTRSIFDIFSYLGNIIEHGDADQVRLHAYPELLAETTEDAPLLTVLKNRFSLTGCFIGIGYEGQNYCVPEDGDGAANTKKIFSILNALLALKTSADELPVTQTVRIAP